MVISLFQPMLLILASLFFLPALRSVDFGYCNGSGYDYGNISRVHISPNPVWPGDNPNITFYGLAYKGSSDIIYPKIVVAVKKWGDSGILAVKEFIDYDHVIQSGKNFEFSIIARFSEANMGKAKVSVTLIQIHEYEPTNPSREVETERICVDFYFPSPYT